MSINVSSNFLVGAALPADDKIIKADIATRDAIPTIQRYAGMIVTVQSPLQTYQLGPGLTNADWVIFGSGGITGSGIAGSVAYFNSPTNIVCDAFFTYKPATEVLVAKNGYACDDYDVVVTRYIDPAGSDANDGLTAMTAWLTPAYAIKQCLLGAPGKYQIVCGAGSYTSAAFDVQDMVGRSYDSNAYGSLIEFVGDETTPSNIVFSGNSIVVSQNSKITSLRLAGIRLVGNGTNNCIYQSAGNLYLRNVEADNFITFHISNYGSVLFNETSTNPLVITNTFNGFSSNGATLVNNNSISLTAPNATSPCKMWSLYNAKLLNGTGCTFTANSIIVTGSGYGITSVNSYIDLGSFNTYSTNYMDGFFNIDGGTYIKCNGVNSILATAPTCIGRASGLSYFNDTGTTTWNFSPTPATGIVLKTGAQFTSPNILHDGLLILSDLVDYIQVDSDPSYTRYALDRRYTEKVSLTCYGEQQQSITTNYLSPAGYSSDRYICYIAKSKSRIINFTVINRVAPGVLLPDTYYIYVNAVASSLSASLTTGTSVTVTGIVDLVAGDLIDIRVSTSFLSQARDMTVQFEVEVLGT